MTAPHDLVTELTADGDLSPADALAVRRRIWPDGRIGADEAELLFALNDAVAEPSREWVDCFVEALVEYVVGQAEPEGYVDEARAAWLIDRVRRDGRVGTLGELELLVRVLEKALNAPESLKACVLQEVERAVLSGEGPTRGGGAIEPGRVTAAEARLLRRTIFAPGSDGPAHVSAAEAEALFRIKDASLGQDNDPEWERLFVQGVANHLQAHAGRAPLAREEALRLEAFMADTTPRVGGFLARLAAALGPRSAPARPIRRDHDAEVAAANAITPAESAWLRERIDADGRIDTYEHALLRFLEEERP